MIGSYFNQNKDFNRQSSGNFGTTSGEAATVGTLTVGDGTGWYNLDLRGDWRPDGDLKSQHQVSFGFHIDEYKTKSDVYKLGSGNWQTSSIASLNTNSRGKTETQALYLQDAIQLTTDLKVVVGGRLERWKASDGSNYDSTNVLPTPKEVRYLDRAVTEFSPKLSVSYQATDNWGLKSSFGRGVRFPTVNELFKNFGISPTPTATDLAGFPAPYNSPTKTNNPNLRPEIADSWEFSAERLLNNGVWRTSVFGEEKQDALISQTDTTTLGGGFSISSVQNVDKVRTYGIETALQTSDMLINGLDLSGSAAYIHTRVVSDAADPRLVGSQLPLIPVWRASLLGTYHASDALSYSLGWRYSGRQHSGMINATSQQYPDPNPGVYGGRSNFSVFDAKVLYKFDKQWSASLGIDNITNEKYFTLYPYSQRTVFAGFKFDH
jgi:iron complex outermembrane receptor protein